MEFAIAPDLIVLAAGLTFVAAYVIINQVALRVMVLIGTGFYIWYYAVAADTPLWTAIWTSVAMGVSNIIGLLLLWFNRSPISIPKRHKDIYHHFQSLPPGDFRAIIRAAKRRTVAQDFITTKENEPVETLYFILNGSIVAEKKDQKFPLPAGVFLGEVGCITGMPASATTTVAAGSEILEWNVADVRKRSERSARFKLALDAMISLDLAKKVARAGSPAAKKS